MENIAEFIAQFEGFSAKPYLCPAHVPTIGFGATFYANGTKVRMQDKPITKAEALLLLEEHLKQFQSQIKPLLKSNVTNNQFNALLSFAYNCGVQSLAKSTLLKKVNNNPDDLTIVTEFMKWINANGKPLQGLKNRRIAESSLYFN
jgi:lysozyme